jgi:shikimate kinase
MPGGGKSTVGKELARQLDWRFADCDREVELRSGCTVATLFERDGEPAFRDLEAATLGALVDTAATVIATGGGAVLRDANRELLRRRTCCVYLRARPEFLWRRLRRDRRRPLLQVAEPEARLRAMSAEREPLYLETAAMVVDVEGLSLGGVVEQVLRGLELGAPR